MPPKIGTAVAFFEPKAWSSLDCEVVPHRRIIANAGPVSRSGRKSRAHAVAAPDRLS